MRAALLFVGLAAACASAPRPAPAPLPALPAGIRAVDLYGTERFTAEELRRELGEPFEKWLLPQEETEDLRLRQLIEDRLRQLGFAWGQPSAIGYFRPEGMETFVTLDVVEPEDEARRMAFGAEPQLDLPDVDGLCADWWAYQEKGFQLLRDKLISPKRPACTAFHCVFGFEHPELARFGKRFDEGAAAHRDELVKILRQAKDAKKRAAAAFLLAHLRDGKDVVRLLLPSLRDPSGLVRNNAMRVLQDIAHHHPEIPVPIEPALEALDFPETTDRNKALAMVEGLADKPEHREAIRSHGPTLVKLLRLQQPNNHDFAWEILKKISGKSFGAREYAAWERWLVDPR